MTYFGIRNHSSNSDAALINWSSYSNILKPEVEHLWPELVNGRTAVLPLNLDYDESKDLCFPENNQPLLYEHFEHLTNLWKDFKHKSFITNRRTMRLLSEPFYDAEFEIMVKEMTIENEKRIFYIFNDIPKPYVEAPKAINAIYTLTQRTSDIGYTEYYCKTKNYNGFDFHYTSKIDAFHSSNGNPIELKSLKDEGNYFLNPKVSYLTAIQCYLADVDKLLCGYYNNESVKLKLFSWQYLNKTAATKGFMVDRDIAQMENSIKEITDFVSEKGSSLIGKAVNIFKKRGRNFVFTVTP